MTIIRTAGHGLNEMLKTRNAALLNLDFDTIATWMPGASREVVEMAAHKARYECTALPADCRHQSAEWLRSRSLGRFNGTELLPEGELPL